MAELYRFERLIAARKEATLALRLLQRAAEESVVAEATEDARAAMEALDLEELDGEEDS